MESVDWNAEAVAYADIERAKLPARIGAKASGEWGFAVLYGTGRYDTDEFTRRVLDELRKELDGLGFKVVGFGVDSEDGCTWAMLVDCQVMSEERLREVVLPIQFLNALTQLVFMRLCRVGRRIQAESAEPSVSQHGILPDHSANRSSEEVKS